MAYYAVLTSFEGQILQSQHCALADTERLLDTSRIPINLSQIVLIQLIKQRQLNSVIKDKQIPFNSYNYTKMANAIKMINTSNIE